MVTFFNTSPKDKSLFEKVNYEVVTTDQRVFEAAKELGCNSVLGVDTENSGLDAHLDRPLLLQVATSEKCFIFPAYIGLNFGPIRKILESKKIIKVLHNAKYDWKFLAVHYDIFMDGIHCTQVMERLLTVGLPGSDPFTSLNDLTKKYLGITLRKEIRNAFINRDPVANPITKDEFRYSALDTVLLPEIYYQQKFQEKELSLGEVFGLESDVLPPIADAELEGVLLDLEKWRGLLKQAENNRQKVANKVHSYFSKGVAQKKLFGLPSINLNSPDQVKKSLKKLGVEVKDTDKRTLEKISNPHPVIPNLLEHSHWNTFLKTFGEKLLARVNKKTGRLHCNFNQVKTETGRKSSSKPNLQNIPKFDPDDPDSLDFRSCFIAKPGFVMITADFSQQELRILADITDDPTFKAAYKKGLDLHKRTASVLFGVPYDKVTYAQRYRAKTLNFFLIYGGGAYSLSQTLKISEKKAQKAIDDYFKYFPNIGTYLENLASSAVNDLFSQTISGRKRFYAPLPHPDDIRAFNKARSSVQRRGKNTPIQGGAADVTKKAMAFLYKRFKDTGVNAKILMIVHDEFVIEVREDQKEEVAKMVEEEMVKGFSYFFKKIPAVVDMHIGPTWQK